MNKSCFQFLFLLGRYFINGIMTVITKKGNIMDKVLVIAGPTAVGKTALSIELAKKFNGEVISGDSLQVYKKLDIGTAKVTAEEMDGVVHHLIDIKEPTAEYTAADFQTEGRQWIEDITSRGKLPIVVGGTGLYIQTLLYDFKLGDQAVEIPCSVRQQLEEDTDKLGALAMWERLQKQDPKAAEAIHPNNVRRVIRALEVVEYTGHSLLQQETPEPLYDIKLIALDTDRNLLYQRINQRVDLMMEQGLLKEAQFVDQLGEVQSARGIGYKEFKPYFAGAISLKEAIEQVKQDSRRYAKRQLTWFRNRLSGEWYDLVQQPQSQQQLEDEIAQWLEE